MPYWLPYTAGEAFARSKQAWIAEHQQNRQQQLLAHGHAIGKAHQLYFDASALAERVSTRIAGSKVHITHPPSYDATGPVVQLAAHKASIRALRKEAEMVLPLRLATLSAQTGLGYKNMSIKQLKSRWGSCSSDKEITLNLFLMQRPWHLIDYVLVHELVHTKVMQHGAPFWAEMERHLSGARSLRKQMGAYQPVLRPREP